MPLKTLKLLRTECADLHEQLHQHPLLQPLQSKITREQYKKIIETFYIAYQTSEAQLNMAVPGNLENAPVMVWLEKDLTLNRNIPRPSEISFLEIDNISKLIGYLYTKQGSTLGGQVISKHLEKSLGLKGGIDNYFFHGYGTETGTRWRNFINMIEQLEPQLNPIEVVNTAKLAFENIRKCCDLSLDLPNA